MFWRKGQLAGCFTARGESLAAFDGRCIPAGCVAPRSNTPGILSRRALPAGRLARLGATPDFHHGLLRTRDYLNSLNHVALENPIDDLDAVEHLCEDGVLVVEPRVVDEIDEDLRVARVVSPRRDADRAAHVRPQSDFVAPEARVAEVRVRAGAAHLAQ